MPTSSKMKQDTKMIENNKRAKATRHYPTAFNLAMERERNQTEAMTRKTNNRSAETGL